MFDRVKKKILNEKSLIKIIKARSAIKNSNINFDNIASKKILIEFFKFGFEYFVSSLDVNNTLLKNDFVLFSESLSRWDISYEVRFISEKLSNICKVKILNLNGDSEDSIKTTLHELIYQNETIGFIQYFDEKNPYKVWIKKDKLELIKSFLQSPWKKSKFLQLRKSKNNIVIENVIINENGFKPIEDLFNKDVFIIGPSGSGKTTIGNNIACLYNRILFIRGADFKSDIIDSIKTLKPECIYIDDINFSKHIETLNLLDTIQKENIKYVITYMFDSSNLEKSSLYVPGIRPGRVDKVIITNFLTIDEVKNYIIKYTSLKEDNLASIETKYFEGYTWAYLQSLIEEINKGRNVEDIVKEYYLFLPKITTIQNEIDLVPPNEE